MSEAFNERTIDVELQVRLMNLVLGEASDFERDQLQMLMEQRAELAAYYQHLEHMHGLLCEVGAGDLSIEPNEAVTNKVVTNNSAPDKPALDASWRLSADRREKLLAVLEGTAQTARGNISVASSTVAKPKPFLSRWYVGVLAVATAACLLVGLMLPAVQSAREAARHSQASQEAYFFDSVPSMPSEPLVLATGPENAPAAQAEWRFQGSRSDPDTYTQPSTSKSMSDPARTAGRALSVGEGTQSDFSTADQFGAIRGRDDVALNTGIPAAPVPMSPDMPAMPGGMGGMNMGGSMGGSMGSGMGGGMPGIDGRMAMNGMPNSRGMDSGGEMGMGMPGAGVPGDMMPSGMMAGGMMGGMAAGGMSGMGNSGAFGGAAGVPTSPISPTDSQLALGVNQEATRPDGEKRNAAAETELFRKDASNATSKSDQDAPVTGPELAGLLAPPRIMIEKEESLRLGRTGINPPVAEGKDLSRTGQLADQVQDLAEVKLQEQVGQVAAGQTTEQLRSQLDPVQQQLEAVDKNKMQRDESSASSQSSNTALGTTLGAAQSMLGDRLPEFPEDPSPVTQDSDAGLTKHSVPFGVDASAGKLSKKGVADQQSQPPATAAAATTSPSGSTSGSTLRSVSPFVSPSDNVELDFRTDASSPANERWFTPDPRRYIAGNAPSRFGFERKPSAGKQLTAIDEQQAATEAFSTFSLHVSDVSFKLAQAALSQGQWPETAKIRIEEFVNALDYHDPLPAGDQKVACRVEQAIHPFLMQRNLLRVSMRTSATGRSQNTPLRLTLVLDNSGSMERPDRRQAVMQAVQALASQLRASDQVTLISFANTPRLLADKVPGNQGEKLLKLIGNLPSEGGTNIEAALLLAREKAQEQKLAGAQNRIVLFTDGAVNLGNANPESLAQLVTQLRDSGIAFDAAGISAADLNDEVLEALTRQGDGRYYLLDSSDARSIEANAADAIVTEGFSAERISAQAISSQAISTQAVGESFAAQIAGALRPSAQNVKVQVEFNPERVGRYKLLGFEKHRLNKEDFRNDKVDAAEMAAAEAGVAVYQFEIKPNGSGDVGSVSVRFRDLSTGQMIESRWPIPYDASAPRLEQAEPTMQLAATAALFAAKLSGGPLADSIDLTELQKLLANLADQYASQPRVVQLRTMLEQAKALSQ